MSKNTHLYICIGFVSVIAVQFWAVSVTLQALNTIIEILRLMAAGGALCMSI